MPKWINQRALLAAGLVVVLIAGFFALRWLGRESAESVIGAKSSKSIAAAWADAILQFAIQPVFPPEEDLTVGDVLAYVVADNDPDPRVRERQVDTIDERTPFLQRAVKVAHVNVRKKLQDTYAELPIFPGSVNVLVSDKQSPNPEMKSAPPVARLFLGEVPESHLPRVAIPSLKTEGKNSAAGGIAVSGQGSASFGGSNEGSEEFHLSEVSTYGLPSARAMESLNEYCKETKDDCRESTVRRYLQPIVGDRIYAKILDPQGKEFYPIQVGLVVVSRVYLARSIVHRRREGRAQNVGLFGSLFGAGNKVDDATPEPPTATPSGGGGNAATDDSLIKRVDELEKQLARMRTGAGVSSRSSASSESAFDTGQLVRPVAVGFRYVQFQFPKDEDKPKDEKDESKSKDEKQ